MLLFDVWILDAALRHLTQPFALTVRTGFGGLRLRPLSTSPPRVHLYIRLSNRSFQVAYFTFKVEVISFPVGQETKDRGPYI
jgi:hypothetical protein